MKTSVVSGNRFDELRREIDSLAGARVRVGVLGNKASRAVDPSGARHPKSGLRRKVGSVSRFDEKGQITEGPNNPTLGLWHEFGVKDGKGNTTLPARSFLRMPLGDHLQDEIDKIGRAVWRRIVMKQGLLTALHDLGIIAVNVVQRAFANGGFGQWAKLSRFTIRKKGSSAILIDSAQLRKSIAYQVARRASE